MYGRHTHSHVGTVLECTMLKDSIQVALQIMSTNLFRQTPAFCLLAASLWLKESAHAQRRRARMRQLSAVDVCYCHVRSRAILKVDTGYFLRVYCGLLLSSFSKSMSASLAREIQRSSHVAPCLSRRICRSYLHDSSPKWLVDIVPQVFRYEEKAAKFAPLVSGDLDSESGKPFYLRQLLIASCRTDHCGPNIFHNIQVNSTTMS